MAIKIRFLWHFSWSYVEAAAFLQRICSLVEKHSQSVSSRESNPVHNLVSHVQSTIKNKNIEGVLSSMSCLPCRQSARVYAG